jgi:hypothetical protein
MSRRQSLSFGLWLLLALVPTCSPSMASSTQTIATLATSGQPTTNLTGMLPLSTMDGGSALTCLCFTVTTVTMDTNPLHVIQHANWTAVVSRIQDPANRGYIMSTAMTASLILALFGYRFIRVCKLQVAGARVIWDYDLSFQGCFWAGSLPWQRPSTSGPPQSSRHNSAAALGRSEVSGDQDQSCMLVLTWGCVW